MSARSAGRRAGATLWCVVTALGAVACNHHGNTAATSPPSGTRISLSTQKSEYSPGEVVVVNVAVTNGDPAACSAYTAAEATLSVVDLTRDDQPVLPRESSASYINGMTSYLRQRIAEIGPGQTITLDYDSPLTTSHLAEGDEADTSIWSVDQPGVYRLSLRFVPPTIPGGPANQCPAAAEPAGVSFTVRA